MTDKLYIRSITGPDIQNGPGIRLTVWVQGCKHHCPGCHNTDMQAYNDKNDKPYITVDEAFNYIKDELIEKMADGKYIYDGITFSGGDPFAQKESALNELKSFIKKIRSIRPDINIWIYTGFTFSYLYKETTFYYNWINEVQPDVIVDGRFMLEYKQTDPNKCVWRGSTNQHLIDVKKTIVANGSIIEYI